MEWSPNVSMTGDITPTASMRQTTEHEKSYHCKNHTTKYVNSSGKDKIHATSTSYYHKCNDKLNGMGVKSISNHKHWTWELGKSILARKETNTLGCAKPFSSSSRGRGKDILAFLVQMPCKGHSVAGELTFSFWLHCLCWWWDTQQ